MEPHLQTFREMAHPHRLPGISYTGLATYFVTACTLNRAKAFDLLLASTAEHSDLPHLVATWKQATGYQWSRTGRGKLWQRGYWERVLRDDEPELSVARYIIENPVRAGLVSEASAYPLTGPTVCSVGEIVQASQMLPTPWRP